MRRFVIDASLAVKWLPLFASESLVSEATRFLERHSAGELELLVPDLFWPEVANVLWKSVQRRSCRPEEASAALSTLQDQDLATVSSLALALPALGIAMRHHRSVYDSLYVALAVASHSELVTADQRLANALGGHLPVKWLGAF